MKILICWIARTTTLFYHGHTYNSIKFSLKNSSFIKSLSFITMRLLCYNRTFSNNKPLKQFDILPIYFQSRNFHLFSILSYIIRFLPYHIFFYDTFRKWKLIEESLQITIDLEAPFQLYLFIIIWEMIYLCSAQYLLSVHQIFHNTQNINFLVLVMV